MSTHDTATVNKVMSSTVYTVDATDTVQHAIRMMRDQGVSSLVVERRDQNDEFGLLVIADVAREVIAENRSAERVNVYEVMSKPVLTLPAEMRIKYAVRLLVRFNLSRAVVVDHDRQPVGIVTLRDMVLHYGAE